MFGAISEKFRTFDMQINFAIPPISHFRRWLGEFFFPFIKVTKFLLHNSLGKLKTFFGISRQSLWYSSDINVSNDCLELALKCRIMSIGISAADRDSK